MNLFVVVRKNYSDFEMGIIKDDVKDGGHYKRITKIIGIKDVKKIQKFLTIKKWFLKNQGADPTNEFVEKLKNVANAKQIWIHERSSL